MEYNKHTVT